jgi:hypothetical protein
MRIGGSPAAAAAEDMPTMNMQANVEIPAAKCPTIVFKVLLRGGRRQRPPLLKTAPQALLRRGALS